MKDDLKIRELYEEMITGGYPSRAEYVNRSKFSESKEKL